MKLETISDVVSNYKSSALASGTIVLSFATVMDYVQPILACIGLIVGIILSLVSARKQLAEMREVNLRADLHKMEMDKLKESDNDGKSIEENNDKKE